MSHYYIFPVGDWSGDGHAYVAEYLIKGEQPLDEVRKTHLANNWIGDICKEYEDKSIYTHGFFDFLSSPEVGHVFLMNLIEKHGLNTTSLDEEQTDMEIELTHESLIELWCFILNQLNPNLKLEVFSEAMSKYYIKYKGYPVDKSLIEGDINFYGFNEKGEHLNTPGYGVWECDESEFYLACN